MQLTMTFDQEIKFLLCLIDIYSKHAWVFPLKHIKGETITNVLPKYFK